MEEFIVAMHLCDMGMKGEPIPTQLPLNLVPPNLRRNHPSNVSGAGTPGSVRSGEGAISPASFEDKRRENWEAGQAELSKRRYVVYFFSTRVSKSYVINPHKFKI